MKICISAESAIDLSKELLNKYDIHTTPFSILLGDNLLKDGEFDVEEIFDYVNNTKILPKTSAVNEFQFSEHFETILKTYDAIIHISMSASMSCAYQNAVSASKNFNNVYVVDSKNLSTGIGLLAMEASEMAAAGKSVNEILEWLKSNINKVQTSLIVNKLDFLRKGGRCSALTCLGANLLQIHPQLILKDGKLHPAKKYRGNYDRCIQNYCLDTLNEFNNYNKKRVFLTYTRMTESNINNIKQILKDAGFKEILEAKTGATIASHAGPDAMGILYLTI